MSADFSLGLEELTGLINLHIAAWHDFGYENPPTPDCATIPPLGERSANAIKAGHEAIEAIDQLNRQLYALRSQLASELRQDEDVRADRVDAMLARLRQARLSPARCQAVNETGQQCIISPGHAGGHRDVNGYEWGEGA